MRSLLIASAGLALASGGAADAQQRTGASYGAPGAVMQAPMADPYRPGPIGARLPVVQAPSRQGPQRQTGAHRPRWGSKVGGRWWGGANAPGGWAGYRRPHRGWAVPSYWNAPRFYVGDWSNYGLAQPPYGYNWARYYDDAVLIDSRGSVYDTMSGIDWDRADTDGYGDGYGGGYGASYGADYAQDDAVYANPDDRGRYADRQAPRRDNGLGGAAIGAVAGGVAGNVIAGRGNRLGGTLIGAGIGAGAGYAIDRHEDRDRRDLPPPPPPAYGARYGTGAGYAPPAYRHATGGTWVSPDGVTTVTTTNGTIHDVQDGGTTLVIQSAPAVTTTTTTTTEYYSYRPRKVARKRVWRAKPACNCR